MADSFVPPQPVRSAARRGLDLRKKWGRGGLSNAEASDQGIGSGVQRATNLANGDAIGLDTIQRMANFFSRHQKNYRPDQRESDGGPTAGTIAWYLWGGNAGRDWANRILREQDSMKAGNRNNRSDRQRIRQIRQQASAIVATTLELEPSASDELTAPAMPADAAKAVQIDPNAHPGAMVALMLSTEQQAQIAAYRVGDMDNSEADHITLLYLGDDAQLLTGYKNKVIEALACIASECEPVAGKLNGYGRFSGNDEVYPVFANYDSPALFRFRAKIIHELTECCVELPEDHGFTPHLTLGYLPLTGAMPALDVQSLDMNFPGFSLIWAGERIDYMLFGMGEGDEDESEDEGKVSIEIEVKGDAVKGFELQSAETQPIITGIVRAIKSDGEWALEVLGVPFGGHNNGRDSDGEYFSQKTNIYQDKLPSVPAVYFHGWDENNQPATEPAYIGMATYDRTDAKGHWYKVILDKASSYAQRVWTAAKQGIARASSGSITHLVRKERDGHITHWPVAELSIFDAVGKRQPANQYAVAMPVLKSVYAQAGLTLPDDISTDSAQAPEGAAIGDGRTPSQGRASAKANETEQLDMISSTGVLNMSEVNIQELVAQSVAAALAQRDAAAKAEADRQAEITNAVKRATEEAAKATRETLQGEIDAAKAEAEAAKTAAAEARRLPGGGAPHVAKFEAKYDGLSIEDLSFMSGVLNSAKGMRIDGRESPGTSEGLRRALAIRLLDSNEGEDAGYNAAKAVMPEAVKGMKANELNYSTLSSYGDEWIGVTYSTQLWDKIRLQTQIVSRIPTVVVPQGSESIVIPVNTTSPTFYKVAQATAQDSNPGRVTPTVTTSRMGTTNKTLTVSKLGAAVNYSGELEEDSLIPWIAELRRDLIVEGAEVLEHVVIDGDTATGGTTNINDIGGTPGGTEAFLLFDGFRKLALVTNTANSRSAGTLTIEDYLETIKLMGLGGKNAVEKSRVSYIVDMFTHWKSLELAELKTQDVYSMPTIEEGVLRRVYGYDVLTTDNMHRANQDATYGLKANTSGKIDLDTASNNTTGSILAVRWDQWRLGYKRNWTFEVQRDAISDSTVIVGMMRVGMVHRDTEASAISYNVTL